MGGHGHATLTPLSFTFSSSTHPQSTVYLILKSMIIIISNINSVVMGVPNFDVVHICVYSYSELRGSPLPRQHCCSSCVVFTYSVGRYDESFMINSHSNTQTNCNTVSLFEEEEVAPMLMRGRHGAMLIQFHCILFLVVGDMI